MQGFRIINSGQWPGDGSGEARIKVVSNNNTIEDNNASNNSNGIFIIGGNNNTIKGNTASSNLGFGLKLTNSSKNIIFKNNLDRNYKNNAYDNGANYWDNGTVGNYYGDFDSLEEHCNNLGNCTCNSGHPIPAGPSVDHHPSFHPF